MQIPTIDQYMISTCLHIVDEFNEQYATCSDEELAEVANTTFSEMDLTVRLGYPFRNMAHFTVGDKEGKKKKNHDIYIQAKDYKIEVKYLRNWQSSKGKKTSSAQWERFQLDFDWILEEIQSGNKNKRAFIIGWFTCVENFSQLVQLGYPHGRYPLVRGERLCYFPFLYTTKCPPTPTYTKDLVYDYSKAYEKLIVNPTRIKTSQCNCIFIGSKNDRFHFAIYF